MNKVTMFANLLRQKKIRQDVSLPRSRKVRGYEIKRMPLGAYLIAMQRLQNFPAEALEIVFPGLDANGILAQLKKIDTTMLGKLAFRAFSGLPKYTAALLAALTDIPEERLLNDPAIGLDGVMEVVTVWIEVNGIENFIRAARELKEKVKAQAANTASKG